jgi:hypothetical protein
MAKNKIVEKITEPKPPAAGRGRPKGAPNKTTAAIKDMILGALDKAGGEKYLLEQSSKNPTAFMGLLAKVMPTQITGADDGPVQIKTIERRIVDPNG